MVKIAIDGQTIEQISSFKYLGSIILEDGRYLSNVKTKITMQGKHSIRKKILTKRLTRTLKKEDLESTDMAVVLHMDTDALLH